MRLLRLAGPVLLGLAGIAACAWMIGRTGLGAIAGSLARLGPGGFLLYVLATLPTMLTLGGAWAAGMRERRPGALLRFAWARSVREAVSDLLPLSQLGGLVAGIRVLIRRGEVPAKIYTATIVDLTTEMVAQLILTLFGLWMIGGLVAGNGDLDRFNAYAWTGAAVMAGLTGAVLFLQQPLLRLATLLAGRVLPAARDTVDAVRVELLAFGRWRGAMIAPFLWNLAAWMCSIASSWIGIQLLGSHLSFGRTIGLEALIFALRSAAFVIPGAIGVQEAGYLLLAPLFGLPAELALTLSLVKRARDIALGVPTLIIVWSTMVRAKAATV